MMSPLFNHIPSDGVSLISFVSVVVMTLKLLGLISLTSGFMNARVNLCLNMTPINPILGLKLQIN